MLVHGHKAKALVAVYCSARSLRPTPHRRPAPLLPFRRLRVRSHAASCPGALSRVVPDGCVFATGVAGRQPHPVVVVMGAATGGGGGILERDKFDVDKFGCPISYQIFPSILRMRCVKMCAPGMGCRRQPSRGHQEITAAIHQEATARDLTPSFSFISKEQFQICPLIYVTPPNFSPPPQKPQIIPPVVPFQWPLRSCGMG